MTVMGQFKGILVIETKVVEFVDQRITIHRTFFWASQWNAVLVLFQLIWEQWNGALSARFAGQPATISPSASG